MSSSHVVPAEVSTAPQRGVLATIATVFGGWHFPVVAMTLVLAFALLTVMVTLTPPSPTGFGAFAAEFMRWCFGWDGETSLPLVQVAFMVSELLVFAVVLLVIWWGPIRTALRERRRAVALTVGVGLAIFSVALVLLMRLGALDPALAQPLRVESLRTGAMAPALTLVDQDGVRFDLAEHRGEVVLVTAVYATCGNTCPMLMAQAKRAVAALSEDERRDLTVVAITLDPRRDTLEVLTEMAKNQNIAAPRWRLLTGEPALVEETLDRWEVARRMNPETMQIDHVNLFMLVDRQGRQAFRLPLARSVDLPGISKTLETDERERWLIDALKILLAEP